MKRWRRFKRRVRELLEGLRSDVSEFELSYGDKRWP
jgi:hypothetical protein